MSSQRRSVPPRRHETGFTLIELLVVITILGILAAIVVFAVNGINDRGKAASIKADAATLRTAEEAYCAKFGKYAEVSGTDGKSLVESKLLTGPSTLNAVSLGIAGNCGPAGVRGTSFQINDTTPATLANDGLTIGARPLDVAVNSNTNRIFTANSADDTVSVLDGATDAVIANISLPADTTPNTLAVSESKQKLYVGSLGGAGVTVIDTTDDDYDTPAPVTLPFPKAGGGTSVVSLDVDPVNGDAYVGGGSGPFNIMVIDGTSDTATDLPTSDTTDYSPGGNFAFDVAPGRDKVYAREQGGLLVIDGASHAVTHVTFPGSADDDPASTQMVAVNTATNRIYAAGVTNPGLDSQPEDQISKTYIVDGATDAVDTTLTESGLFPIYSTLASDPGTGLVYELAVDANSYISVLDGTTRGGQAPADPPRAGAGNANHTMVINPTTNRLYMSQSATSGSGVAGIVEVNLATLLTNVIAPGRQFGSIAVDTKTNKIYALDRNNGQVAVLK